MAIEPTDEMIYAFAGEPEITATDAHAIKVGLTAVLAIVERDHIVRNKPAPEATQCGNKRWGVECQLPPAHYGNHGHSTWQAWA